MTVGPQVERRVEGWVGLKVVQMVAKKVDWKAVKKVVLMV